MNSDQPSDYAAAQEYLFSLKAGGVKFGIQRMALLAEELGHPELAVPCIHIAGTNGKGSTAAMLEAIFRAAGWRTGLYTSPHLVRLGERVQVNRQRLSEEAIVRYTRELRGPAAKIAAVAEGDQPSFFEFMTAMAFCEFAQRKCDISILEVGLGGRLDATNIVRPEVAVITSIGLDHCELLGDTIEKIAAEKAGIIKPGVPVVLGRLPIEAENVIRAIAAERGAPVHAVTEIFSESGADGKEALPETSLAGEHQRWNAAVATLVARLLPERWRLGASVVAKALKEVNWAGRWQRLEVSGRQLVLDASHNPEGAEVLGKLIQGWVGETGKAPVIVVGVLGAARARPLIEVLSRFARELIFVVPKQERACGYEQLEALVPASYRGAVRRGVVEELFPGEGTCAVGATGDLVLVTGSIYLLGEILARLEPERGAGEGRLQDF